MTERPILFSAPMVRALLDGTKTQTRRVVKLPRHWVPCIEDADTHVNAAGDRASAYCSDQAYGPIGLHIEPRGPEMTADNEGTYDVVPCPYGVPGDRLWVRETWTLDVGTARKKRAGRPFDTAKASVYYRATYSERQGFVADEEVHWRPSRITLEVTGVRVERLQVISEEDAKAEGCRPFLLPMEWHATRPIATARKAYERLWESINGAGSWAANPFVWVIEFRRLP